MLTGYVQAQPADYDPNDPATYQHRVHHSHHAQGHAASKAEIFVFESINYFTLLILLFVFLTGIVFLNSFLHRKSPVCPVKLFLNSSKLEILASDEHAAVVYPQEPAFNVIVSNFSDDRREPQEALSVPLRLTIGLKRYIIEVSDVGWNFKGERHGCRRLKDAIALVQLLNQQIEEKIKKKGNL